MSTSDTTLPAVLDAGDGVTYPRVVGLRVAQHIWQAQILLTGPGHNTNDLALHHLAHVLGGDHWLDVTQALMDQLEQGGLADNFAAEGC